MTATSFEYFAKQKIPNHNYKLPLNIKPQIHMKRILLFSALVYSITANCQTIIFNDSNFESALLNHSPKIDTNSDGKIQIEEAAEVIELKINDKSINSIDEINYFKKLKKLNCNDNRIKNLTITDLPLIEEILCRTNGMEKLSLFNLELLNSLICGSNNLTILNLKKCPNLLELYCLDNNLSKLHLKSLKKLENLVADDNILSKLSISACANLRQVHIRNNNITSLDISKNQKLKYLYVDKNVKLKMTLEQEKTIPSIRLTPPPPQF